MLRVTQSYTFYHNQVLIRSRIMKQLKLKFLAFFLNQKVVSYADFAWNFSITFIIIIIIIIIITIILIIVMIIKLVIQ